MRPAVLLLCLILLSGCATFDPWGKEWEEYFTHHINVTSEPSDAEVYINDVLVGRTPAESLPVTITMHAVSDFTGSIERDIKGQIYIRVSKDGYKNAVEPLRLIKGGKYHFVLEKTEQSVGGD